MLLGLISAAAACFLVAYRIRRRPRHLIPPGPPSSILLGNIFQIPKESPWLAFAGLRETYGDITYFHGLGNGVLVLNSLNAIYDLLDKRGNIYSHRPILTVGGELMGLDQTTVLMHHGPEWREHRKLAHIALNPAAVKKYHESQEKIAALLCRDLLDRPKEFHALARLAAGRVVMSVTYGLSIENSIEHISYAERFMVEIGKALLPGAYLCDLLPFLKYSPSWVPFQKEVTKMKGLINKVLNQPFDHFRQELQTGTAGPSLASDIYAAGDAENASAEMLNTVKWVLATTYNAGAETTHGTTVSFILAMARYPDKLRHAQAEIDRVLGGKRMPTIADMPNLPYVNALIKETMRWCPVVPMSLPRRLAEDDEYMGYHIPKGTIVMPNVWCIAFAPNRRHDPHKFIPERFLDSDCTEETVDPFTYSFGFGRRACPGKALGQNSVFIFITSILASFNISFPEDCDDNPDFLGGVVSYPKPFRCNITPRSADHAQRIRIHCENLLGKDML